MGDADRLRAKAQRCRRLAEKHPDQSDPSPDMLAVELERRADGLDAQGKADLGGLFGR